MKSKLQAVVKKSREAPQNLNLTTNTMSEYSSASDTQSDSEVKKQIFKSWYRIQDQASRISKNEYCSKNSIVFFENQKQIKRLLYLYFEQLKREQACE